MATRPTSLSSRKTSAWRWGSPLPLKTLTLSLKTVAGITLELLIA
jgi:hypothetical protein